MCLHSVGYLHNRSFLNLSYNYEINPMGNLYFFFHTIFFLSPLVQKSKIWGRDYYILGKRSFIFSLFRVQHRLGGAAFLTCGCSALLQSSGSITFLKVRGHLHFVKAGLLCPMPSAEDSSPGALYLYHCSFNSIYYSFVAFLKWHDCCLTFPFLLNKISW